MIFVFLINFVQANAVTNKASEIKSDIRKYLVSKKLTLGSKYNKNATIECKNATLPEYITENLNLTGGVNITNTIAAKEIAFSMCLKQKN